MPSGGCPCRSLATLAAAAHWRRALRLLTTDARYGRLLRTLTAVAPCRCASTAAPPSIDYVRNGKQPARRAPPHRHRRPPCRTRPGGGDARRRLEDLSRLGGGRRDRR